MYNVKYEYAAPIKSIKLEIKIKIGKYISAEPSLKMMLAFTLLVFIPTGSIGFTSIRNRQLSTSLLLVEKSAQTDFEPVFTGIDSDKWIKDSYELENERVLGPKQCLVYDTTLRGGF